MVNITLFSLNLENPEFTANAPFSSDAGEGAADEDAGSASVDVGTDDEGGPPLVPLVVGLVLLVVLGVLVRKLRNRDGGDDTEQADLEDLTA